MDYVLIDFVMPSVLIMIVLVLLVWKGAEESDEVEDVDYEEERCPWCTDIYGKTDLDFGVIDDSFGQYVHYNMINYCPFCGRYVKNDTD